MESVPLPPGERLAVQVTLEAAPVLEAQVEVLTAEIARQVAEVPEVRLRSARRGLDVHQK